MFVWLMSYVYLKNKKCLNFRASIYSSQLFYSLGYKLAFVHPLTCTLVNEIN